jgi:hypothetical protein
VKAGAGPCAAMGAVKAAVVAFGCGGSMAGVTFVVGRDGVVLAAVTGGTGHAFVLA